MSSKTGDRIVVKSGEYILSDSLRITGKKGIKITGEGSVLFLVNDSSLSGISIINSGDITIKNIGLVYTGNKTAASTAGGVYLENANDIIIDHCRITGFSAGIYSIRSRAVTVKLSTIFKNTQWALYGNYTNLELIENDLEHNGGLFFINGKDIHSVGITFKNVYMKNNWAADNGGGRSSFLPVPFKNRGETVIPSPLSQELKNDRNFEEGITGSSVRENLDQEFELYNKERIDRRLENSDLYHYAKPLY
ncbi:MAG: hypothetical protein GXP33_12550 [Spirochaetes bacterium]|nr:hypothetical protein [Spirochaetota bacterium]